MTDLILMGGGGHCRSAIDVIEAEGSHRIMGVLEDPVSYTHLTLPTILRV